MGSWLTYVYLLYVGVSDRAAEDNCPNLGVLRPEAQALPSIKWRA